MARQHHSTVTVGADASIYYEVTVPDGDPAAPVVVLTHGAGAHHAMWFQQVLGLADHYRVVTWDARGHGRSTGRPGDLTAELAASDLAAVLDHAGISERVHLVGQSLGGWFVVRFALDYPDRVASLVLVDSSGGAMTDELDEHWRRLISGGVPRHDDIDIQSHPGMAQGSPSLAFLYHQLQSLHDVDMRDLIPIILTVRYSHDAVRAIGVPMLVVVGEHDIAFPAAMLQRNAQLLGSECFVVPGTGHSPYFEQPDVVNERLRSFFSA